MDIYKDGTHTRTFRDDYYRSLCDYAPEYDKVIDWIAENNPAAKRSPMYGSAEEFAASCVHSCIRSVVFGDAGAFSATGMCLAVRASSRPEWPSYKKVRLAIQL
jgi:hypothetical protein